MKSGDLQVKKGAMNQRSRINQLDSLNEDDEGASVHIMWEVHRSQ